MVEIDGVVMRECAKHMRATAGDSMDNYNGDNYQIYCEDCIPRLAFDEMKISKLIGIFLD